MNIDFKEYLMGKPVSVAVKPIPLIRGGIRLTSCMREYCTGKRHMCVNQSSNTGIKGGCCSQGLLPGADIVHFPWNKYMNSKKRFS
jgi:hypothetical protein